MSPLIKQSATYYLSSPSATSHQVLYPYQLIPSFYMSLPNNFENSLLPEWVRVSVVSLLDIRSLSHSSLILLSWPLSLGVLHPPYWWYTGQCGPDSTFSGCALVSFLPLTFSEPITSLSSAPFCFHFSCAGLENRGGGRLFAYRISKYFPTWRTYPVACHVFQRALRMKSLYFCSDGVWPFCSLYQMG